MNNINQKNKCCKFSPGSELSWRMVVQLVLNDKNDRVRRDYQRPGDRRVGCSAIYVECVCLVVFYCSRMWVLIL